MGNEVPAMFRHSKNKSINFSTSFIHTTLRSRGHAVTFGFLILLIQCV